MKPESSLPSFSPEQSSIQHGLGVEHNPIVSTPEKDTKNGAERYEQIADKSAVMADVSLTTILPAPVNDSIIVVKDTTISDNPAIAKDDDLIEREWVDKAKKIVAETQNDPYRQEEAVNKLQVDYMKKRYGKELDVAG